MAKRLLLISSSKAYGGGYLDHCEAEIKDFLRGIQRILFIPYARPSGISYEEYTGIARAKFQTLNFELQSIHEMHHSKGAVEDAEAIFIGGGNTFVLLNALYHFDLINDVRSRIDNAMPYIGASAGANVACPTIMTTNDMPIIFPPSFDALGVIPFQINPHYLDPDPNSQYQGETRETRILEYHVFNDRPVVALREGAWLRIEWPDVYLKGKIGSRLFARGESPKEFEPGSLLNFLLKQHS